MTAPPISGAERVIEWFGHWPSLHDATINELHLVGRGESRIVLSAFEYLSETDSRGYLKTTKQCRIVLVFSRASDITLASDSGTGTIMLDHAWTEADGQITFEWGSAVGLAGSIRARDWRIELQPIAS